MPDYLHNHSEFKELLRAVEHRSNIDISLVEKDYWIMHILHGLRQNGFQFELKGGTSLSKGYGIIHRFSEDIDIRIEPPSIMDVKSSRNQNKPKHCESRKKYYDWLANNIKIKGINKVDRDTAFDDKKYRSGGIRLYYKNVFMPAKGIKEGILLEVGFAKVTPNTSLAISSWALDFAKENKMEIIDNKAYDVKCYHPGYTFVEKLETVLTKFRKFKERDGLSPDFMRHYYDIACLLSDPKVIEFIKTSEYIKHKEYHFSARDKACLLSKQEALRFEDPEIREIFEKEYKKSYSLYYQGQIPFNEIINKIASYLDIL